MRSYVRNGQREPSGKSLGLQHNNKKPLRSTISDQRGFSVTCATGDISAYRKLTTAMFADERTTTDMLRNPKASISRVAKMAADPMSNPVVLSHMSCFRKTANHVEFDLLLITRRSGILLKPFPFR
jgi:hypothetical protein